METRWSWVQPLHSRVASIELRDIYEVYNKEVRNLGFESIELRDIYEVYNREVRKLGFEPKTQCL